MKSGKLSVLRVLFPRQDALVGLPHQEESQARHADARRRCHDGVADGAALLARLRALSAEEATEAILQQQQKGHSVAQLAVNWISSTSL